MDRGSGKREREKQKDATGGKRAKIFGKKKSDV